MITTPASLADESASAFYAQLTAFRAKVFDNEAGVPLPSPAQS
jgi:hypothetical protein